MFLKGSAGNSETSLHIRQSGGGRQVRTDFPVSFPKGQRAVRGDEAEWRSGRSVRYRGAFLAILAAVQYVFGDAAAVAAVFFGSRGDGVLISGPVQIQNRIVIQKQSPFRRLKSALMIYTPPREESNAESIFFAILSVLIVHNLPLKNKSAHITIKEKKKVVFAHGAGRQEGGFYERWE